MSKHHIENLGPHTRHSQLFAERIANKGRASAPFHNEKKSDLASEIAKSEDNQTKADEECSSIKLQAYQIHREKGGSDLDNWLEAEQSVKSDVSRLINEGDPNTQK